MFVIYVGVNLQTIKLTLHNATLTFLLSLNKVNKPYRRTRFSSNISNFYVQHAGYFRFTLGRLKLISC